MSGVAETEQADELDAYERARFQAARECGLTRREAAMFAYNDTPLHTLWKLKAAGCKSAVIARIVT